MSKLSVELHSQVMEPLPASTTAAWQQVATHTHNIRSGQVTPAEADAQLLDWCRRHDVAAVGLGSPWEPVSKANYLRHEGPERDRYYSDAFDPASVMDHDAILTYFRTLNTRSGGTPLFYQDNETPKCRYGHLWWFGYDYDRPCWHDYSQDRPIWYHDGDSQDECNPLTGRPHTRRAYLEVVGHQRSRGAVGVWAHPTSWWTRPGQANTASQFVTNIAAECVQHLWIDGRLDGLAVSGYHAFRPEYQKLWFRLLDTGAVVPGFAETDTCFDRQNLPEDARAYTNRLHLPSGVSAVAIRDAASAGACMFGTGGFLHLSVDGTGPGSRLVSAPGSTHEVELLLQPRAGQLAFGRVELIGPGGTVLWTGQQVPEGRLRFRLRSGTDPAYLVARAWGEGEGLDGASLHDAVDHQVCNPVYLHPPGFSVVPMSTEVRLNVAAGSPWIGGELIVEDASGSSLERVDLRYVDAYRNTLPASARIRLTHPDRRDRTFYLLMENLRAQALSRYLWDGWFRRDFPSCRPGEVPIEAFHISENREVLARMDKII